MPTVNLTPFFVRSATCPSSQRRVDYFDTEQRGFLLEVRSSGGKTFYQRYNDTRGRLKQCKLGSAEVLTVEQAREKGREIVAAVLLGADPQQARIDLRAVPTLAEFIRDRYLPHAKQSKRSWRVDEAYLRIHILPALGRLRLDEVTHEHVSGFVQRMRDRGFAVGTCNRALVVLQHAFNLARRWKMPGAGDNPTTGISAGADVHRQRFLTPEEAQRLIAAIATEPNRPAANAIMLLLLTGARRNEVLRAKWAYVDWDRRTLLVPISKSGKPRTVALSGAALALLRGLTPIESNPYIFPSDQTGTPPQVFYPFKRIRERARLTDLRLHDLRHSFASFLVNHGVALYTVQGLLGHSHSRTTQRYAHLAPKTLLDATEVISEVLGNPQDNTSSP
jgi:integrase